VRKPESGQFAEVFSLGTGHCPVHTATGCANSVCSNRVEFPKSFSLYVYVNFMHLR
jgi:hypothetical protein